VDRRHLLAQPELRYQLARNPRHNSSPLDTTRALSLIPTSKGRL